MRAKHLGPGGISKIQDLQHCPGFNQASGQLPFAQPLKACDPLHRPLSPAQQQAAPSNLNTTTQQHPVHGDMPFGLHSLYRLAALSTGV